MPKPTKNTSFPHVFGVCGTLFPIAGNRKRGSKRGRFYAGNRGKGSFPIAGNRKRGQKGCSEAKKGPYPPPGLKKGSKGRLGGQKRLKRRFGVVFEGKMRKKGILREKEAEKSRGSSFPGGTFFSVKVRKKG